MAGDNTANENGEPNHPVLRREQTLAIVLGASEWPSYPDFHASPSFRRSARDIVGYLRGRDGLNIPPRNLKVLIDPFDDAPEVLRQIRDFVRQRRDDLTRRGTPATDLLLYYVGHGGFGDGDAFFLSIPSTDEEDPSGTSITAESLGRLIRERAAGLRNYLVLDCCFAASVSKVFLSGGPVGVAGVQLQDLLPPQGDTDARKAGGLPTYGTALLCASGPREPAKAPPDLPHTMFTGGLLDVLRNGDPSAPAWLSLDDMQRLVRARLAAQFTDKAVLPQVHAPQQRMGRVDLVPLFRNPAHAVTKLSQPGTRGIERLGHAPETDADGKTQAPEQAAGTNEPVPKAESSEAALARARTEESAGHFAEAARLFKLAADQGNAGGQVNLGEFYRDGRGVPQSDAEAARLYKLAEGGIDGAPLEQGEINGQVENKNALGYVITAEPTMAVKTLVLGFGGTGTHILTYLKELSIYKHGQKPDHLAFIEMDTIARALWKPGETVAVGGAPGARETIATGLGQEMISLDPATEYLALGEAHPSLRSLAEKKMSSSGSRTDFPHLKDWLHTDWLKRIMPPAALNVENGAAQQRQIGRFGMVGNVRQITNAIRRAFEDLRRAEPSSNVVRTWLICSSAGGTGAGCIIDGAAMVRMVAHELRLQPTVTGIIALPEVYAGTVGGRPARAYSLFRELERFQGIGFVTPADEISTDDRDQPTAWSVFNYDRKGALVPARLFDYLFYLGENCPDLRRRISFFKSVSTAVDTFLDDNIGSGMMEALINQDGHPLTFGGSRLSIPLNTYSELFVWEQAVEYLHVIGAPVEQPGEPITRVHWGTDSDRQDAATGRVDSLLPLFADVRAVMTRDRRQWPNYVERELAPQTIVKKWYQFAEPALSGVDVTPDQLVNDIPLTYCNPFIFLGDDEDSIKPEEVEIKTYGEASKAKLKESQSESISRFAQGMSDRLEEYTSDTGGIRSFAKGRALVRDSITRLLNAKIDDRLTADINAITRIVGDPDKPNEGTQLTRLYRELSYLTGDSSPLYQIQDVLTQFSQHLDEITVRLRQEAVNEIRALKDTRAPSMPLFRNWAEGPQVAARDKCMDYIRIYQKRHLIHDSYTTCGRSSRE